MNLKIVNKIHNSSIFQGSYEELVEYCGSPEYDFFLEKVNKKDYYLTVI